MSNIEKIKEMLDAKAMMFCKRLVKELCSNEENLSKFLDGSIKSETTETLVEKFTELENDLYSTTDSLSVENYIKLLDLYANTTKEFKALLNDCSEHCVNQSLDWDVHNPLFLYFNNLVNTTVDHKLNIQNVIFDLYLAQTDSKTETLKEAWDWWDKEGKDKYLVLVTCVAHLQPYCTVISYEQRIKKLREICREINYL